MCERLWAAFFGLSPAPVYKCRMAKPSRPDYPLPVLITTTDALQAFCQRMHGETFVTVDTEFMRERTYWPELCLVQIAGDSEVAVIDAEAEGIDLSADRKSTRLN